MVSSVARLTASRGGEAIARQNLLGSERALEGAFLVCARMSQRVQGDAGIVTMISQDPQGGLLGHDAGGQKCPLLAEHGRNVLREFLHHAGVAVEIDDRAVGNLCEQ